MINEQASIAHNIEDRDKPLLSSRVSPNYNSSEDVLETKVIELVEEIRIIDADCNSPLLEAFEKIAKNHILSVPIFSVERQKYIGFLDIVDIVHHFLEVLSEEEIKSGFSNFKFKFINQKCQDLVNKSKRNPFKPLGKNASVRAALRLICTWSTRRVPLIDEVGDCVAILSQSRLVQHVAKNIGLFSFAAMPISEFRLGYCDVYKARPRDSTHIAFQKMRENGASALAIVDDKDKLLDVLSVTDLRILGENMNKIGLVTKTVEDFTAHKYPRIPPITVTPHDTVAYVSQLFLEHKIHRIYVVDSDATGRPIGVIGLADYLALFLPRQ